MIANLLCTIESCNIKWWTIQSLRWRHGPSPRARARPPTLLPPLRGQPGRGPGLRTAAGAVRAHVPAIPDDACAVVGRRVLDRRRDRGPAAPRLGHPHARAEAARDRWAG